MQSEMLSYKNLFKQKSKRIKPVTKKKTHLYKRLDTLPLRNWHELNKSISEGRPELRWMCKFDIDTDFPDADHNELIDNYNNLVNQLQSIDIELIRIFARFKVLNSVILLNITNNELQAYRGKEPTKIKRDEAEKTLIAYFDEMQARYDNFKLNVFKFRDDAKELWTKHISETVPEWLTELEGVSFHFIDQYKEFLKDKDYKNEVYTETFINLFFEHDIIIIQDLKPLNDLLKKQFDLKSWCEVRADIFDYVNLECDLKNEADYISDILSLNEVLESNYDPKTVTVAEAMKLAEIAEKKIERQKTR
jgi:hypothetical protein